MCTRTLTVAFSCVLQGDVRRGTGAVHTQTHRHYADRGALAAFTVEGLHANDLSALLDASGICIRSGHHCTQPLHRHYGLSATARASLAFTTTVEEIDRFADELQSSVEFLKEHG